jgi:transposase
VGQKVVVVLGWEFATGAGYGTTERSATSAYGLAVTMTAWRWPEPEHALPSWKRPQTHILADSFSARRLQAAELFAQGRTQAEVARQLGVSCQSAHIWHARFEQGGVDTLRSRGLTGPDPKLSTAQLAKVEEALLQGARANGFDTDLWTLERIAVVITQLSRVRHHPAMSG